MNWDSIIIGAAVVIVILTLATRFFGWLKEYLMKNMRNTDPKSPINKIASELQNANQSQETLTQTLEKVFEDDENSETDNMKKPNDADIEKRMKLHFQLAIKIIKIFAIFFGITAFLAIVLSVND